MGRPHEQPVSWREIDPQPVRTASRQSNATPRRPNPTSSPLGTHSDVASSADDPNHEAHVISALLRRGIDGLVPTLTETVS